MFVGGAGVGKTQLVKGKLAMLPEEVMSLAIAFNYFTDVASFQKVGRGASCARWGRLWHSRSLQARLATHCGAAACRGAVKPSIDLPARQPPPRGRHSRPTDAGGSA